MVAYGFRTSFVVPIRARSKRQTIRLPRKRHARPGEPVQLFVGLRTRRCEKIIPDPVCVGVDEVRLDLRELADADPARSGWLHRVLLEVNGIPVRGDDADAYAAGDGFDRGRIGPFELMLRWWMLTHGPVLFTGFAIRWEDRA